MPTEARTCIHGDIVDGGQEVDCRTIIYWLCITLTKNVVYDKLSLDISQSTTLLTDGDLICHCHHILTQHLPRAEP